MLTEGRILYIMKAQYYIFVLVLTVKTGLKAPVFCFHGDSHHVGLVLSNHIAYILDVVTSKCERLDRLHRHLKQPINQ